MRAIPGRLQRSIEARLRERGVRGLALATFDRDGAVFGGGMGHADLDRGEAVSTATVFRVASVSKLLTTTLVLRAVDAGLLALDRPFNDLLPAELQVLGADGSISEAPVHALLSHTSGLGPSVRGALLGNRLLDRLAGGPPPDSLRSSIAGLRAVRPHGERIVYANSGLNIAGHLAAEAFGQSFEAAAHEHVLAPLEMAASAFDTGRRGPGIATPYGSIVPPAVSRRRADALQLVATPMGGLTTSVDDLVRFGRMVLHGGELGGTRVLSGHLLERATTLQARNHPALEQGYGLGFKVRSWRGRTLVGHDGNMPGVATITWIAPDEGVGVVVLTNGFSLGIAHQSALQALDELLGDDDEAPEGGSVDVARAEALARRVAGRYRSDGLAPPGLVGALSHLSNRIEVAHEVGGRLRVDGNPAADGPMWLTPLADDGTYRVASAVDGGVSAVVDESGDRTRIWLGHTTLLQRR